jgi:cellulose synthase operon protein YhjQ
VGGDTLQDSRERVAARWFALKGVFDQSWQELPAMQPIRTDNGRTQVLAVFSLAGGVGKTSLVATLGRALSSQGERVVLADTTSHGLLPIYFGEREVRPGQVRTILQSEQSSNPAISLVSYDVARRGEDERQQEALVEEILRHGHGSDRLLLDLSSGLVWIIHRMANLHPTVVVPLAPDMNSVISLQAVERLFRGIADSDGRPLLPFYVLNQFDATLPLHLDVREVLRRQLGDRLLRFAIRRSAMVSEALAEGMTVVDYAPSAPVSQDILDVALWLRSISPQAAEVRGGRWGEP